MEQTEKQVERMNGYGRKALVLFLALVALLVLRYGGELILETMGLGWRKWPRTIMFMGELALFTGCGANILAWLAESPWLPDWMKGIVLVVGGLGLALGVLAVVWFFMIFGSGGEHITEFEGQKAVAETTGIFRQHVYRYENWFVHGELLYIWED